MSEADTERKVKEIVAEVFHRNTSELTSSTDFVKDLHAKSANMIELIALLEDAFSIEIPFAQVINNSTIGSATEYVTRKLSQKRETKEKVEGRVRSP
ncbi:MAG: acyl carrier protein [Nitrososphaerota archaeon]|nr:acyl carrier protein [Nitrososphaerota archaeon]